MRSTRTALCIAITLALGSFAGCGEDERSADEGKVPPTSAAGGGPGAGVERRLDEAAEGVRRAGERVEVGADKAAEAIDQAGGRAHARIDEAEADRAATKQAFLAWARQELAKQDQALRELEAQGKAADEQAKAKLRAARDRAQQRIDELEKKSEDTWAGAKRDVELALEQLRADIEARGS